mmetsp:Transcript_12615/g.24137  ORF Transcript_12615/g.24137 Transcript_12615/m.24137 type:complete len:123 (+) Transcript_12615:423-791(+)
MLFSVFTADVTMLDCRPWLAPSIMALLWTVAADWDRRDGTWRPELVSAFESSSESNSSPLPGAAGLLDWRNDTPSLLAVGSEELPLVDRLKLLLDMGLERMGEVRRLLSGPRFGRIDPGFAL